MTSFVHTLCAWQQAHGRHNLPWQSQDPYKVWLSEIMLQQTQVTTVIDYYQRFLERFPDIFSLAAAEQSEVLSYWAGLGYYARARNLHRCAQIVVAEYQGVFPQTPEQIMALPGIGRSTAHAIMAFCYNAPTPIMDGNVKRLFTRYFGIIGPTTSAAVEKQLWAQAEATLQTALKQNQHTLDMACYTQALMDFGSLICTRSKPQCERCPLAADCYAKMHHMQQQLPTPKAKKSTPTRHTVMLMLVHEGQILLEQRPQAGIWGGLLSLPEFADEETLLRYLQHRGLAPTSKKELIKLAAFEHIFSHFKLHIQAYLVRIKEVNQLQSFEAERRFYPLNQWQTLPLPKPVSSLLDTLRELSDSAS